VGIITCIAQVLQEGVQFGKIVIEGGHLAPGAGLGVRRTSGFTHGFLYRLAILISWLQHLGKIAMKLLRFFHIIHVFKDDLFINLISLTIKKIILKELIAINAIAH